MSTAQNGWPVVERSACVDLVVHGVTFPNGVLAGDVATVLGWVAEQHHTRIDPLNPGWCWGYDKKRISGSDVWSNHAAGCAIDIDAPAHPQGVPASSTMSTAQIKTAHTIETDSGNVVRWGGDFSRPDAMHWEIIGSPAQVAALAKTIRGKRTVTMISIDGELPDLHKGDTDPVTPGGTNWIKRAQTALNYLAGAGLTLDGEYGDLTAAAVKKVMAADDKRTTTSGSRIAEPEWRRLYGIW